MNEGFFGQYSVFCVFGSVVGCVVVPLIAQLLQQQSMECVILSAIVISLTAAHLNKKAANDATASYSKIVVSTQELERKKANHHYKKHKSHHHQHQHHQQHNNNISSGGGSQMLTTAEQLQMEYENIQQRETMKTNEAAVERRGEEKRLKKLRKREERLRKREEETRRRKEVEELSSRSVAKEKQRVKQQQQQKENYHQTNKNYIRSAAQNLQKFCGVDGSTEARRCGLSLIDSNRGSTNTAAASAHTPSSVTTRSRTFAGNYGNSGNNNNNNNNNTYYQQKIPRFERNRTASCLSMSDSCSVKSSGSSTGSMSEERGGGCNSILNSSSNSLHNTSYTNLHSSTDPLTIKCNLSASCSSLSSLSSLSSGSASPPMSASSHNSTNSPGNTTTMPWSSMTSASPPSTAKTRTTTVQDSHHPTTPPNITSSMFMDNGMSKITAEKPPSRFKSYSSNRAASVMLMKTPSVVPSSAHKFIPDSSSLFCSQLDGKMETTTKGGSSQVESSSRNQPVLGGGEYSLFGPRGFVTSLAR
jgi:hypothetical protein